MSKDAASHGRNLYPLAEHFLGILDSPDPEVMLGKEVQQYSEWKTQELEALERTYGKDRGDPRQRLAAAWTEQDIDFLLLDYRRNILSVVVEAVDVEETLLPEIQKEGSSQRGILEILRDVFEQMDELPCPEEKVVPRQQFSFDLRPPMQRIVIERKELERKRQNFPSGNVDYLYEMQATLLNLIFDKWILEFLPKEMLKVVTNKVFIISKGWKLVVFDPV